MMDEEQITVWVTASFRKYVDGAGVGFPVSWSAQGNNPEPKVEDEAILDIAFEFPRRGSRSEAYALVAVRAVVKTVPDDNDVYRHVRLKARLAKVLNAGCVVSKRGGDPGDGYDLSAVGVLRRQPHESLVIQTTGTGTPDASALTVFYEFLPC